MPPLVDVVTVSYNSSDYLRAHLEPLSSVPQANVVVVDNASHDGSLETLTGLPLTTVPLSYNAGFSHGCNVGAAKGSAPFVLFLNPDASLRWDALERLVAELEDDPTIGAVGPRIVGDDGTLHHSLRRFPRLVSTFSQALLLHRLFPFAVWTDEVIRRPDAYERPGDQEWISGACMLVRRTAFDEIGGFDEGFFLFCEDTDLCARLRDRGHRITYRPDAVVTHVGGASAPFAAILPVAVTSRIRYARKHRSAPAALLERFGIGLGILTRLVVARGGATVRRGHATSLRAVLAPQRPVR
jgi:N-acetylglucosaminyl-diphospho-decaprenol L-rhamnosyltransferase